MKKVIYLVAVIFMTIIVISCAKKQENKTTNTSPTAQLKKPGGSIELSFRAGHDAGALCTLPYQGDFMPVTGSWIHIPCIGNGSNCGWVIKITTNVFYGSVVYNTTYPVIVLLPEGEGMSETEFEMPARSLLMQDSTSATSIGVSETDSGVWINLAEQVWERIDSTHYRLSIGIEFDTIPEYLP